MAWVDPETFALSLNYLIGLLVFFFLIVVPVLLAVVVSLKWLRWHTARKLADRQARMERVQSDGTPYPPAGRGLCDSCQNGFDKVYYLCSGQRLCPSCYEKLHGAAAAAKEAPGAGTCGGSSSYSSPQEK
jgi:hypothetical protein